MLEKDLLKRILFLSEIFQEHLSEIAQWGKVIEFDKDDIIFQKGDKAFDLYAVVNGAVDLSLTVMDEILKKDIQYEEAIHTRIETIEKEIVISSITPGKIFGWSAMIEPKIFTNTAKCSKPSRILSLPADKLKTFFNKNPQVGYVFMERLAEVISERLTSRTDILLEGWSQAFDTDRVQPH